MKFKLSDISQQVEGTLQGDGKIIIQGVAGLREAQEGDLSFLANPKYLQELKNTHASAVLVPHEIESPSPSLSCIQVENPYYAFSLALRLFYGKPYQPTGVSSQAVLGEGVSIGKDPSIGPFVTLEKGSRLGDRVTIHAGSFIGEETEIGDDCLIYPNVTLRERVVLGKRVIVHSGTVIGSDGYGYAEHKGQHHKILQIGNVTIEDDVELGANVAIDRAALGKTVIGRGTKVDNLVQIAHNVNIGQHCLLVAQVGISGSTELGNHVTLAGQVGVVGHIRIGDQVIIGAQSGVSKDVSSKKMMSGTPVMDHREWLKAQAVFSMLPEMKKRLASLEKQVKELTKNQGRDD
jgi:UDP-3-O-[3-hydroxymyristoyl] glucosamine N-acyltransferase